MKLRLFSLLALASLLLFLPACGADPRSATGPAPTWTPNPTWTPRPTWTSMPTFTPSSQPQPSAVPVTPQANPATPTPAPKPSTSAKMQSPEYGIQAFLWWYPMTTDRDLKLAQEAGFTWVKHVFDWGDIEGAKKGALDWTHADRIVAKAEEYGLNLLIRLSSVPGTPSWAAKGATKGPVASYSDYGDFVFAVASRYRGKIRAYEIWNEPNKAEEWGGRADAVEYVKMLKTAYERIKQADPNAMVVSAGLTPTTAGEPHVPDELYLKRMYAAGAMPYFDVLGAHGAGFRAAPDTDPAFVASGKDPTLCNWGKKEECSRVWCFRHVEDLRKIMVENGDAAKQVMITEFGWDSDNRQNSPYKWHYVSEDTKAQYIVDAFRYAKQNWSPWIGAMMLIYISAPDWKPDQEEKYWWAITNPDGTVRPAYTKFKEWRAKGSP